MIREDFSQSEASKIYEKLNKLQASKYCNRNICVFNEYNGIGCDECEVTKNQGHWIMSDDGLYRPICDKCGAHPWKGYIPTVKEATEVFKFCPNCGAKMESEE